MMNLGLKQQMLDSFPVAAMGLCGFALIGGALYSLHHMKAPPSQLQIGEFSNLSFVSHNEVPTFPEPSFSQYPSVNVEALVNNYRFQADDIVVAAYDALWREMLHSDTLHSESLAQASAQSYYDINASALWSVISERGLADRISSPEHHDLKVYLGSL